MIYGRIFREARYLGFRSTTALTILGLQLASIFLEGIGIGMLLPCFEYIQSGGDIERLMTSAKYWSYIVSAFGYIGIPLNLLSLFMVSFFAIIARQVFSYKRSTFEYAAQERAVMRIRNDVFGKFLRAELAYRDQIKLGGFINDFLLEMPRSIGAIISAIRVVGAIILVVSYVTIMASISTPMTLITLGMMGGTAGLVLPMLRKTRGYGATITESNREISAFLTEKLNALRLIRLSGAEQTEATRFAQITHLQVKRSCQLMFMIVRADSIIEPLVALLAFTFLYLGTQVLGLALGEIGVFLLITLRMFPLLKESLKYHQQVLTYSHSQKVIIDHVRDLGAQREQRSGSRMFEGLDKALEFHDICFRYPTAEGRLALDGVSLVLPARTTTAIVGPSGSGKSTLIDLIPRLREPNSGQITLDGIPLTDFTTDSLRNGIAYVPQNPLLLNVTVAEHLRYGRAEATDEEMEAAARHADALDFIRMMPNGFETLLGDAGNRLSGGQRQRLDIARALLRRPSLLILDEPTSALDADAEALFRETLAHLQSGRDMTIIVIAHRLSTVVNSDNILVMRDGKVDDFGPHDDLIARQGWYSRAYSKQSTGGDTTTGTAIADQVTK